MTPHTIYFVRHGETVWNAEGRLQGRLDSPLTQLGENQARKNGETLRDLLPGSNFAFVSSPLGRARATMEIIRTSMGLPRDGYSMDDRLREIGLGDWDGLTWDEIRSKHSQDFERRTAARWTFEPSGGGESYADTSLRLRSWISDLAGDAVVVAHGIVGQIMRGLFAGLTPDEIIASRGPKQDRIYRLGRGTEAEF
jgi:probable phosphoglycerate mutase